MVNAKSAAADEMFDQDFQSDEDEDNAACQFGFGTVSAAKNISDLDARGRYDKSRASDDQNTDPDVDLKECKRNADCQPEV
jgi:hypothetical protein